MNETKSQPISSEYSHDGQNFVRELPHSDDPEASRYEVVIHRDPELLSDDMLKRILSADPTDMLADLPQGDGIAVFQRENGEIIAIDIGDDWGTVITNLKVVYADEYRHSKESETLGNQLGNVLGRQAVSSVSSETLVQNDTIHEEPGDNADEIISTNETDDVEKFMHNLKVSISTIASDIDTLVFSYDSLQGLKEIFSGPIVSDVQIASLSQVAQYTKSRIDTLFINLRDVNDMVKRYNTQRTADGEERIKLENYVTDTLDGAVHSAEILYNDFGNELYWFFSGSPTEYNAGIIKQKVMNGDIDLQLYELKSRLESLLR